jgi:hypothetical protein
MEWLSKEIKKDQKLIDINKEKLIEEIKKIDKTKIFTDKKRNKKNIFQKILLIFGSNGK